MFLKPRYCIHLKLIRRQQGTVASAAVKNLKAPISNELKLKNENDEYTVKPEYPDILDLSLEQRKLREKLDWHNKIKNLNTIEEKLIKFNIPKYYGFRTISLRDASFPYNCLPLTKHYTRTLFEEIDQLPLEYYGKNAKNVDSFVECFKSSVQDSIEFTVDLFKRKYGDKSIAPAESDRLLGEMIVQEINRNLLNSLISDCSHLNGVEIDFYPRHEAFWVVGGVNPPKAVKKAKEGRSWTKKYANDCVDRYVQYVGKPYLTLKHKLPLQPIYSNTNPVNAEDSSKIPLYKYDPKAIGYQDEHRHLTATPGHWPGNPYEFGLLSYQKRDHLIQRNPDFGIDDLKEAIHAQGIQSSYAWLLAQAFYQGFSTFHELTYPMTAQTVITNGQNFSFYVYQLNTTLLFGGNIYNNPRVNYCWGTKELKLFEEIDHKGKCIGFNEDVLKKLINFYANEPIERIDVNLKPYLGTNEQKIADIEHVERREFLESKFKFLTSNRPRHHDIPEIYAWERIYKVDNKTRPFDKKRRFFEIGENPFKRTLDDHPPEYVPKVCRPDLHKSQGRYKKMYYP